MGRMGAWLWTLLLILFSALQSFPQQHSLSEPNPIVPPLIRFSGVLTDPTGQPLTEVEGVTFSLYPDSQSGVPLWMETQNVQPDRAGHFTVMLGSSKVLATDLFVSGEARWLSVQAQGQAEQPRILLLSVPYALKAADAETLGGKPASAFLLATPSAGKNSSNQVPAPQIGNAQAKSSLPIPRDSSIATSSSGTTNFIPLWKNSTSLGNSTLFQAAGGQIGLATTNPGAKFDVLTTHPLAIRATATSPGAVAIDGRATASSGAGEGLVAETDSAQGIAGIFNNNAKGQILSLRSQGVEVFSLTGTNALTPFFPSATATLKGGFSVLSAEASIGIGDSPLSFCSNGCGLSVNIGPADGIVAGAEGIGVTGAGQTAGVLGIAGGIFEADGIFGKGNQFGGIAGNFDGDVNINGHLTKSSGSFKIDHPLDPANKYLYHSFVESPDMKNVYDGVAMLDAQGEATIKLPNWFEALNRDFRYQLTSIGAPGPNLYIAEEISANQFKIAGGKPGGKVSWQVTGTRQDAWANAHRIPVEEVKNQKEIGHYIHPELYGATEENSVEWARRPKVLRQIKDMKATQSPRVQGAQGNPTTSQLH
jgi:hypothetical protein